MDLPGHELTFGVHASKCMLVDCGLAYSSDPLLCCVQIRSGRINRCMISVADYQGIQLQPVRKSTIIAHTSLSWPELGWARPTELQLLL